MKFALVIQIIINVVLAVLVAFFVLKDQTPLKDAYIVNQYIFESFSGQNRLKERLEQVERRHVEYLDSLKNTLSEKDIAGIKNYEEQIILLHHTREELVQTFTADIWKQINGYLKEYGKKNQFRFIYGATGSGNLMYADEIENISEEVIQYINQKYEGNE